MVKYDGSFGYCTNVHAGTTLTEAKNNLLQYAAQVRELIGPQGQLPIGLWLTDVAAEDLVAEPARIDAFKAWLADHAFTPYTCNAFPQLDFHQSVVKLRVYEPTWCCEARAKYTMEVAEILAALLPEGAVGSVSTMPLGWPHAPWHAESFHEAADNLLAVARYLQRLHQQTGREIVVAIEPEPGCVLDTAEDVVEFFEHYLFTSPYAAVARRYLTVCHDVCHSGVMFEPQHEALERYLQAGIRVGKVQISSAVHVPWDQARDAAHRQAMLEQLKKFNEPKYMHQTTQANEAGRLGALSDDLPNALERWIASDLPERAWRVHFHVPIYLAAFGELQTTQADIVEACRFLSRHAQSTVALAPPRNRVAAVLPGNGGIDGGGIDDAVGAQVASDQAVDAEVDAALDTVPWFTGHYEVETYAWGVLPSALQPADLAEGIAQEMQFLAEVLAQLAD